MRLTGTKRLLALAALAALLSAKTAQPAFAQTLGWSFEDHPNPIYDELTPEEFERARRGMDQYVDATVSCRLEVTNEFEIYENRYPEFRTVAELSERYRSWKRHAIAINKSEPEGCMFVLPGLELIEASASFNELGSIYCGAPLEFGETSLERRFFELTSDLMFNAQTLRPLGLKSLLYAHQARAGVYLNPDIEYFVRKTLEKQNELEPRDWDISALLPLLSEDRLAFVNQAVEDGDLLTVVETTGPCATPNP